MRAFHLPTCRQVLDAEGEDAKNHGRTSRHSDLRTLTYEKQKPKEKTKIEARWFAESGWVGCDAPRRDVLGGVEEAICSRGLG
jgi:hypothetical protein